MKLIRMSGLPHSRAWIPPRKYTPPRAGAAPWWMRMARQCLPSQVGEGRVMSSVKSALTPAAARAVADSTSSTLRYVIASGLLWLREPVAEADVPKTFLCVLVHVLVPVDPVPGVGQAPDGALVG